MKQVGLTKRLRKIKENLDSGVIKFGLIEFHRRIKEDSLRTTASKLKLDVCKKSEDEVYLITKKKEDNKG